MKILTMAEATEALKRFMPTMQTTNWKFALDDMRELMADLGNPQEKLNVIHVAGTSGKTSTSYYLADMLYRLGCTVGLTVSPHVDTVNERVQLNGQPLPEAQFCQLLGEFLDLPVIKAAQPSYFAVMIAFAYWVFAKQKVDYTVIEVGLGGRLDATNVINRTDKVCVITDIGLDHVAMLGNTLGAIAGEKACIMQPGNQTFVRQQDEEVMAAFREQAQAVRAKLTVLPPEPVKPPANLPTFQQRNWDLAKQVVKYIAGRDHLNCTEEQLQQSASLRIPARMETVKFSGKTIIIDGAHNAQKINALCQGITKKYPGQKLAGLVSFSHDKDDSMAEKMTALHGVLGHLIITTFAGEQDVPKKSMDPELIKQAAAEVGFMSVQIITDPQAAFEALLQRPESKLLVTGSFYLLNHIRPLVKEAL